MPTTLKPDGTVEETETIIKTVTLGVDDLVASLLLRKQQLTDAMNSYLPLIDEVDTQLADITQQANNLGIPDPVASAVANPVPPIPVQP